MLNGPKQYCGQSHLQLNLERRLLQGNFNGVGCFYTAESRRNRLL